MIRPGPIHLCRRRPPGRHRHPSGATVLALYVTSACIAAVFVAAAGVLVWAWRLDRHLRTTRPAAPPTVQD